MLATTTLEAFQKVKETFSFDVHKYPLSGPDNTQTPWYGLFRSDNFEAIGSSSVSEGYVPHQTDDVLALVESAAHAFDGDIDVRCKFDNGHIVSLLPSREQRLNVFGTDDNVFPRVIIRAGYNNQAFKATMGMYRDACRNLMMLRSVDATTVSFKHTSSLRSKINELVDQFNILRKSWITVSDVVRNMNDRQVNMVEFLNAIYGEPAQDATTRSLNMHQKRTEQIINRLLRERQVVGRPALAAGEYTVSAWEAYNAVQGYAQHDATRRGNLNEFDRALVAFDDRSVHKAEQLALAA